MRIQKIKENLSAWWFLLIVVVLAVIVFLIKPTALMPSLTFFWNIILKIIPVFVLIFVLMVLVNLFIKSDWIVKYLGKSAGIKGWLFSIVGGILSAGPIYMWYPLLNELQKKGARNGYVAAFLYNRAIKIPLLPLFIYYFGLLFVIVLTFVMIIASVFQGIIVEKVLEVWK